MTSSLIAPACFGRLKKTSNVLIFFLSWSSKAWLKEKTSFEVVLFFRFSNYISNTISVLFNVMCFETQKNAGKVWSFFPTFLPKMWSFFAFFWLGNILFFQHVSFSRNWNFGKTQFLFKIKYRFSANQREEKHASHPHFILFNVKKSCLLVSRFELYRMHRKCSLNMVF